MKLCGINTRPAVLACLQCSIAVLNVVLVVYALLLFTISLLFMLWMEYYISGNSRLAFTIVVFMISVALSIFCFSCLACPCILRTKTHKVFSYLVSTHCTWYSYMLHIVILCISVQRLYRSYLAGGDSECPGDLPVPRLPQPGPEGGDLLQHGEVRDEHRHQPGGGPAAGQCRLLRRVGAGGLGGDQLGQGTLPPPASLLLPLHHHRHLQPPAPAGDRPLPAGVSPADYRHGGGLRFPHD